MGRFKIINRPREFRITSAASASGPTGQTLSITATANYPVSDWGIVSGSNVDNNGSNYFLTDVGTAGNFSFVMSAIDNLGRQANKTVTLTLTGVAGLAQVTGLAIVDITTDSATFSFNNVAGATGYQVSVNQDDNTPDNLSASKQILGILTPDTDYDFKVRAKDATSFGPYSSIVTGHTDANPLPGPDPTLANRARTVTDGTVLQFKLNLASASSPHRTVTGWIEDHYAPLAAVGILKARTNPGSAGASLQSTEQIQFMNSTYGTKFDISLSADLPSVLDVITNINNYYPTAVNSFQGKNEPNINDGDNLPPPGWAQICLDHTVATCDKIRTYPAFNAVPIYAFSPWGRSTRDMNEILALGWTAQCASKYEYGNLHWYNAGRKPDIAGAPYGTEQDGDPVAEVSLDWTIADYCGPGRLNDGKPLRCSESGWNYYGAAGEFWPARPPAAGFVSLEVQAKFAQVQFFEMLNRGIDEVVWYELIENFSNSVSRHGMLKFLSTDGPFTRTPLYDTCLNTATIFFDSGATSRTFTVGTLAYTLTGAGFDSTIHHRLFQKSNGEFLLAVWQLFQSWKRTPSFGNVVSPSPLVTINFGQTVSSVRKVRPYVSTSWTAVGTNIASTNQNIPDDALVLGITV